MEQHPLYDLFDLPNNNWRDLGEDLYLPPQVKNALIRFPMYRYLYGSRGDTTGLMMLIGDPGTAKSVSTRSAADAFVRQLGIKGNALVINPAGLQDEHLGRTQKLVEDLFSAVNLSSSRFFTVLIYDDAENFFMARRQSAASNDPTDVIKATTTLLHGLDRLRFNPNIVQYATLNISGLVDEAILSRCDVIIPFNLPDVQARTAILARNLKGLAGERILDTLVAVTEGKSGRDLNKINLLAYLQGTGTYLEDLTETDYLVAGRRLHTQLQTSEGRTMRDFITQPIPGYLTPDDQVALALHVIQSAAELLQFSEWDSLVQGLAMIRKQLLSLIAAGALSAVTFAIRDFDSDCGVTLTFDLSDMDEYEESDLSRLRLAASTTGTGRVELVCLDGAITSEFSQVEWLPPSHPNLAWSQVQQSERREDTNLLGEEQ